MQTQIVEEEVYVHTYADLRTTTMAPGLIILSRFSANWKGSESINKTVLIGFLLAWPSQDVFLLPHIPWIGQRGKCTSCSLLYDHTFGLPFCVYTVLIVTE